VIAFGISVSREPREDACPLRAPKIFGCFHVTRSRFGRRHLTGIATKVDLVLTSTPHARLVRVLRLGNPTIERPASSASLPNWDEDGDGKKRM